MNRIVLGGAQLGLPYGILNNGEAMGDAQVAEVLDTAFELGINEIDTAIAYGNSEALIGAHGQGRFAITSKLPPIPDVCADVQGWVGEQIASSLSRLRVTQLDALLLHQPSDLKGKHGENLFSAISQLKKNQLIKRFGVSIYSPQDLDGILGNFELDVVQTPFSVFDQRINAQTERLSSLGIEIHARSIFLQGVLLSEKGRLPSYFDQWQPEFERFYDWIAQNRLTAVEACVAFVINQPHISRIVIGALNTEQLLESVRALSRLGTTSPFSLRIDDVNLVDPRRWNID
jgi:aryl-alcohol dehydrogenase-like predicted oxidoreductase